MAIGHTEDILRDAWQGGHIGDLLVHRLIHAVEELLRGINPGRDTHPRFSRGRNFPDRLSNPVRLHIHGLPPLSASLYHDAPRAANRPVTRVTSGLDGIGAA